MPTTHPSFKVGEKFRVVSTLEWFYGRNDRTVTVSAVSNNGTDVQLWWPNHNGNGGLWDWYRVNASGTMTSYRWPNEVVSREG